MFKCDYAITEKLHRDERWLQSVSDWPEFYENVFLGDFILEISGIDFGVKNNFILGAIDLMLCTIDQVIFYRKEAFFRYPKCL